MKNTLSALIFSFALFLTPIFSSTNAFADPMTLEVTDSQALELGLKAMVGKTVTLQLTSGSELSGVLEAVGPSTVRIGQLTGKEFYSAVVRIEQIIAVVYRAK